MATTLPSNVNREEFEACWKCNISIDIHQILRCPKCGGTFHKHCGKKTDCITKWKCPNCVHVNLVATREPPKSPNITKAKSTTSRRSSQRSTRSNIDHELQLLEEQNTLLEKQFQEKEQQLAEKHRKQQEILAKKIALVRENDSSSESRSSESVKSFVSSKERVENWNTFDPGNKFTSTNRNVEFGTSRVNAEPKNKPTFTGEPERVNFANKTYVKQPVPPKLNDAHLATGINNSGFAGISSSGFAARHVMGKKLNDFDGNPLQWSGFISQFELTTKTCELTNAENLSRLTDCLKGNARLAVKGLFYSPDNVPSIIAMLTKLFGRPEFVVNALIDEVQSTGSRCLAFENFDEIIAFSTQVSNIVTHMKQALMSDYLWNPLLMKKFVDKLPYQYKKEWAEFRSQIESANLEVFSGWLKDKSLSLTFILDKPPQFSKHKSTKAYVQVHNQGKPAKCIVCQGSCPSIIECPEFKEMSYSSKWEAVHSNHLCRVCLKPHHGRCKSGKKCESPGCSFLHNTLLHKPEDSESANEEEQPALPVNIHNSIASTLFKIVPVKLIGRSGKTVTTFALLDDGSALTLIEEKVAVELGLDGPISPLCLQWTNEQQRVESKSRKVDLSISGTSDKDMVFNLMGVHTVHNLALPSQSINMNELCRSFPYLESVPVVSYVNAKPSILIGLDHPKLGLASKVKCGGEFDPVALKSKLGWIVFGSSSSSQKSKLVLNICECNDILDNLDKTVKEFISVDTLGSNNIKPMSELDKKANAIMEKSLHFEKGSYQCNLLWKYNKVYLPNNYKMALKRLDCLQRRLDTEDGLRDLMEAQLSEYLRKGYIRQVSNEEIAENSSNCWYLPVFPVRNPNKPKKLRIVWDAAASVDKVSLNSMLLTGPDLLSCLPGVLLRFREKKFAIAGDLMEMFHQIKTAAEDQKFQWFMWKGKDKTLKTFAMTVMTFGAACSPFIAQYVKNYHARKFQQSSPVAVNAIVSNHYMDDWLESFNSEEEVITVAQEVKNIYKSGGFVIRNWISNSSKVLQALGDAGNEGKCLSDFTESKSEKILGLWWDFSKDDFTYSLKFNKGNSDILNGQRMPTKREMLRIIMSVFDPLGFLAHFLIYAKILLQRVWRKAIGWDELIPTDLHNDWSNWIGKLPEIENLRIGRWYGFDGSQDAEFELHTFVDASEEAYAASVYLRISVGATSVCRLVFAKSRTAPVKALTIPRLELNAAVLGTRLAKFIGEQQTVKISKRFFWSDSRTVICWINSESRNYKQYVSCRIGEILESTDVSEWLWIPTKKNIADIATRSLIPDLDSQSEWYHGPSFLRLPKNEWPVQKEETLITDEEIRTRVLLTNNLYEKGLIDYAEFSTYRRLLMKHMNIARVFTIWKLKTKHSKENFPSKFCMLMFKKAENTIYRIAQCEIYEEEISLLKSGSKIMKSSSLYKRMVYLDENEVLRCKGRIDFSTDAAFDTKRPIILPVGHHITNLVIFHYHEKFGHHNHETVINELRQKFSISRLRTQLWKVRRSCQQCKNDSAKPSAPEMAQLPPARLKAFTRPFSYVGIDFFGPMTVTIGRRQEKRWGMLMTCLTVRAIHLECVHGLSSNSCILGLRNFINRRGCPIEIFSDNGTNLKGASRELKEARSKLDMNQVANEFLEAAIKWNFIPPASPHMGGAWERLVRSVKTNISYITKAKSFRDEYLNSLLIEVECIINSRPLSYIPIDDDNAEALTPNHFLLGSSSGNKPIGKFDDRGSTLRNNWHTIQQFANMAWRRWISEGLPALNLRSKWHSTDSTKQLQVDDIVLIFDERNPRCCYPKGRVIDVSVGSDGLVRKATVKTVNGIYERPVVKLAKLEVYKESGILNTSEYRGGEMLEREQSL